MPVPVQQQCRASSVAGWGCRFWTPSGRVQPVPSRFVWSGGQLRLLLSSCAHVLPLFTGVPEGAVEPDPAGLCEPHRGAQSVSEGCLGLGPESEGSEDCHPGQAMGGCVVFHIFSSLCKIPLGTDFQSPPSGSCPHSSLLWSRMSFRKP